MQERKPMIKSKEIKILWMKNLLIKRINHLVKNNSKKRRKS